MKRLPAICGALALAAATSAPEPLLMGYLGGSGTDDWVSMAVPSDGSYGVPEGLISGFPCTTKDGVYTIVPGLDIDAFSRERIDASVAELGEERDAVAELGLI